MSLAARLGADEQQRAPPLDATLRAAFQRRVKHSEPSAADRDVNAVRNAKE